MGGLRIGGAAALPSFPGPPFSLLEGTVAPQDADQANVWIVDGNGNPLRITPYTDPTCSSPPCADEMHTPRLNPARTQVAYCDFEPDSPFGMALWVVPADGSATYPITPLWSDGGDGSWANHPSWSADGSKILFTYAGPDGGSYIGGTLGGRIMQSTYPAGVTTTLWTPDIQSPTQREEADHPQFSPDGTMIAFLVNIGPGGGGTLSRQGLWVMDADGSNDGVIDNWSSATSDAGVLYSGTQLAWSNDSQWITYVDRGFGGASTGSFSVYKIRPDGTDKTLLADGSAGTVAHYVGWGAWLEDDSKVIYTEQSGVTLEIWSVNADGTGATMLIAGSDGPAAGSGSQNFHTCYRLGDRIYWTWKITPNNAVLRSCALDGTDMQAYFTAVDGVVANGTGFEWV